MAEQEAQESKISLEELTAKVRELRSEADLLGATTLLGYLAGYTALSRNINIRANMELLGTSAFVLCSDTPNMLCHLMLRNSSEKWDGFLLEAMHYLGVPLDEVAGLVNAVFDPTAGEALRRLVTYQKKSSHDG